MGTRYLNRGSMDDLFFVDSIEDGIAALVGSEAGRIMVAVGQLPEGVREGDALRLHARSDGTERYVRDDAAAARARDQARRTLSDLGAADPGGDIVV